MTARGKAAKEMYETRRAEMQARGEAAKEMYETRRAEMQARGEAAKEMLNSKPRESRVAISTLEVASRILDLERELRGPILRITAIQGWDRRPRP